MNLPLRIALLSLAGLGLTFGPGCASTTTAEVRPAPAAKQPAPARHGAGPGDRFMRIPVTPMAPVPARVAKGAKIISCRKAPSGGGFVGLSQGTGTGVQLGDRGFLTLKRSVTLVVISVTKTGSEARVSVPCTKLKIGQRISFKR